MPLVQHNAAYDAGVGSNESKILEDFVFGGGAGGRNDSETDEVIVHGGDAVGTNASVTDEVVVACGGEGRNDYVKNEIAVTGATRLRQKHCYLVHHQWRWKRKHYF